MEITPRELRDAEIAEAFRGYNREVVNDLLERAAASIDASNARVNEVSERLKSAQLEADRSRETEDILHRTLLLAQRAADEAVAEAQQKAREMMEEAELESHKLLAEAQTEAQRRRDDERERLEEEVVDLAARRDTLLSDVDALTQFESEYRTRLTGVLEGDLAMLRERPTSAPGPVPQGHEVELPVAAEAFARTDAPVAPDAYVETYVDTTADTIAVDDSADTDATTDLTDGAPAASDTGLDAGAGAFAAASFERDSGFAPTDADTGTDSVPGDASFFDAEAGDADANEDTAAPAQSVTDFFGGPDPSHEVAAEVGPATREVDMTALFDADAPEAEAYAPPGSYQTSAFDAPAPATNTYDAPFTAETEDEVELPRTDSGFDMLRPDALDAEVLDDDAFFATLREAVHDDSPLGPREEGAEEGDFYGDEGEKASFRDVFRRRR